MFMPQSGKRSKVIRLNMWLSATERKKYRKISRTHTKGGGGREVRGGSQEKPQPDLLHSGPDLFASSGVRHLQPIVNNDIKRSAVLCRI
ncbi:hypothetical protein RRG08_048980 [Elysia crispata]|uniref:Uncharacterized protein n=1 Tax=Elysia crispata TaxID=231223 RepID=A0AAE0YCK5_9GAST|nr:hypothetical protein RRG08_048980 [Elysia crispata]